MIHARVITCSDAASRGERTDLSGPAVRKLVEDLGMAVDELVLVPDDAGAIAAAILAAVEGGVRLVVTTGGTGIAPRDVTPEAVARVTGRLVPGFGERMRASSPFGALSRAQAATHGEALIVNLPGSVRGASECFRAVSHLIPHALELLAGEHIEEHPSP